MRGPILTVLNATLLSLPTTATLYRFCISCTARCGTSIAFGFCSRTKLRAPVLAGADQRRPGSGT